MQTGNKLTRRDFVSSASLLAIGFALFPKAAVKPIAQSGFVIVNGWVLNASEVA